MCLAPSVMATTASGAFALPLVLHNSTPNGLDHLVECLALLVDAATQMFIAPIAFLEHRHVRRHPLLLLSSRLPLRRRRRRRRFARGWLPPGRAVPQQRSRWAF